MEIIFFKNKDHIKMFISKGMLVLFYILIKIKIIYCNSCKDNNTITNTECFNNLIKFDDKTYRAGHHAINKNGDMIIEYSAQDSRLFYGLKENGEYFFGDNTPTKVIENINKDGSYDRRYESINLFISLENDIDKEAQYLFSTSSFQTLTELYDMKTNNYHVKSSSDFIGNVIFSFQFQMLETIIDNKNIYFLLYIYEDSGQGNLITIKKFGFTSFSLANYDDIQSITINNNCNTRIISSYIVEEKELIALFFVKQTNKLVVSFYNFTFGDKGIEQQLVSLANINPGNGIFFKSVYLDNLKAVLIYFQDGTKEGFDFKLYEFFDNTYAGNEILDKRPLLEKTITDYNLSPNITLNDLIKMNNERVVFVSTIDFTNLYIFVFDLYNNYANTKIRVYNYDISPYIVTKELSLFVYNNYLGFTSTAYTSSSDAIFSVFMLFGYTNRTEKNNMFDISLCFTDIENYDINNNIITKLLEWHSIENNIFGYIFANKIKLIYIPSKIFFYNGDESTALSEGSILEFNHRFEQSKTSTKRHLDFFYLTYQVIIQEPEYSIFYENANNVINYPSNEDQSSNFEQKTFEGRINTVKFKLCHEYCATCNTLGLSNNDQKCMSCLPLYQYDYFNECAPEGYYKDKENNGILVQCTPSNSKFYINITTNKTICFKNTYNCPDEYPYWNTTTNECQNFIPPTTITTTIPTTIPATIPTTILTTIISSIITTNSTITDLLCSYNNLLNNECLLLNYNNEELYEKIKSEIIGTYPANGESVVIEGEENYVFQITTAANEINSLNGNYENNYNLSMIDLGQCENLLKNKNIINYFN